MAEIHIYRAVYSTRWNTASGNYTHIFTLEERNIGSQTFSAESLVGGGAGSWNSQTGDAANSVTGWEVALNNGHPSNSIAYKTAALTYNRAAGTLTAVVDIEGVSRTLVFDVSGYDFSQQGNTGVARLNAAEEATPDIYTKDWTNYYNSLQECMASSSSSGSGSGSGSRSGSGGESGSSSDYNEIPVKSYLNLERDPAASYHAATKNYVDLLFNSLSGGAVQHNNLASIHVPPQNTAGYVFQSDTDPDSPGTWTQINTSISTTAGNNTDNNVPSTKAVYTFVNNNYAKSTHSHTADQLPDAGSNAKGVVQLTVYSESGVAGTSDATAITPKAAKKMVDDAISNAASGYAGADHTHAAGDITSGTLAAARLPNATTGAKGGVIVGDGLSVTNGTISVDYTTVKAGLPLGSAADAALVTGKQVYDYVAGLNLGTTYASKSHNHAAGDINSGTLAAARLPLATASARGAVMAGSGLTMVVGGSQLPGETVGQMKLNLQSGGGLATDANGQLYVNSGYVTNLVIGTTEGKAPALGEDGKLSVDVLPRLQLSEVFSVTNSSGLTGLSDAQKGDFAVTDAGEVYVLTKAAYGTAANWKQINNPAAGVTGLKVGSSSATAQTGTVTITAGNLGLVTSSSNNLGLTAAASDSSFPSEKAVTAYVEGRLTTLIGTLGEAAGCSVAGTYNLADLEEETGLVNGEGLVLALDDYTETMTMSFGADGSGVDATNDSKFITAKAAAKIAADTAPKAHSHAAGDISSGTLAAARLPDASASAKGGVILAKAASSGTTDTTNDTKAVTPKAVKQIVDAAVADAAKAKAVTVTGTGASADVEVTHNLNSTSLIVQVYDSTTGGPVMVAFTRTHANKITLNFANAAAATGTFYVMITAVG